MFPFLIGVAVGAGGLWLYRQLTGGGDSGSSFDQSSFAQPPMLGQSDQGGGSLIRPTPSEIHGRPTEPLPGAAPAEPTGREEAPSGEQPGA